MAVRSNYIKNLMENTNSLEKQYQEVVAESMKNIIGENAKDEVRKLLKESEDEDSYEEEEVVEEPTDTVDDEEVDMEDSSDAGDVWDDLEKCKSADGEYDCRGMEDEKLINILKSMGPEDGIRVMSNGDGTVAIEVDGDAIDGEAEYIIDIDDIVSADEDGDDLETDDDVDVELDDDDADDLDVEVELDESENTGNTGYTDDYQHKTAMTTLDNHEPADPKTTYSMDAGVPKGTKKPWAQDGDRQPFNKNVDESVDECGDTIFEIEEEDGEEMVDESGHTVTQNNAHVRGVGGTEVNNSSHHKFARNGHVEAQSPTNIANGRGTGDGYKEANESIDFKKKFNRLYEENKQMKSIIPQLNQKLQESMVINASMGYIVRLLNENTTTVDEKKEISNRFAKVNTLDEGKKLYETISDELKKANKSTDFAKQINGQLAESKQAKQNLVETTMYKSEKVNEALDFMKRLDSIK